MYRQKLQKFCVEIRKQRKLSKFKNLRRQFQQQQNIEHLINKLLLITISKDNYLNIAQIFHNLNESLVIFSLKVPQLNRLTNKFQVKLQNSVQIEPPKGHELLVSHYFKRYLLKIFECLCQCKRNLITLTQNQRQIINYLQKQAVTSISLLFKQSQFLQSYFPLVGISQIYHLKQQQKHLLNQKLSQNETPFNQQEIYLSFQLVERVMIYLKSNFSQLPIILSNINIFLTLLHSLTRILHFFTQNSILSQKQNFNKLTQNKNDAQYLNFLYELFNSNAFQNYLKELILDLDENQNQNKKNRLFKNKISEQNVLKAALCEFLAAYLNFLSYFNENKQLSRTLKSSVSLLVPNCLNFVHEFNKNIFSKSQQQLIDETQHDRILKEARYSRVLSLRILFCIHDLISNQNLQVDHSFFQKACIEMIYFLLNVRKNEIFTKNNLGDCAKKNYEREIKNINCSEYYLDYLVDQKEQEWFTEMELVGCLYNLVVSDHLSLEHLYEHASNYGQTQNSSQFPINTCTMIKFFEIVAQSIFTLSGTFYNQRYIFFSTLVYLFFDWFQSVEIQEKSIKNNQKHNQLNFTTKFMIYLGQVIQKYLRELKASLISNKQLVQSTFLYPHSTTESQKPLISEQNSILSSIQSLQETLQEVLKQHLQNQMETDI